MGSCRSAAARVDACRLTANQFDASVPRAPFERVVGVLWPRLAVSFGRQTRRGDAISRRERAFYRRRPAPREIEVPLIGADAVGMSLDAEFPVGMAAENRGDFTECRL